MAIVISSYIFILKSILRGKSKGGGNIFSSSLPYHLKSDGRKISQKNAPSSSLSQMGGKYPRKMPLFLPTP